MKSVDGEQVVEDKSRFVTNLVEGGFTAAPAAPSDYILQILGSMTQNHPKAKDEPKNFTAVVKQGPSILMRTANHARSVSADEFSSDRAAAMKKIQSSKYTFRYNFGGYIPSSKVGKGLQSETFSMDDFDSFLSLKYCDFLPKVLFEEKRLKEDKEKENGVEKHSVLEARKLIQARQDAKQSKIKKIFQYSKNTWNAEVLSYIDDLNASEGLTKEETEKKEIEDRVLRQTAQMPEDTAIDGKEIDMKALQHDLKKIWTSMHMPHDQQLDMLIKYGSHKASNIHRVSHN